ncbi:Cytochrome p450 86a2 [Globisporangium polare]
MVSTTLSTLAVIAAGAAALVSQVDAHGYIISPKAQGNGIEHPGNFVIEYSPPWEGDWKDPKNFATAAKEKGFSTLRSYLEDKGAVCGFTDPNVSPRAIPTDRKVHFSRDIPHAGPCELWIDDTRVYQNDDCESAFTGVVPEWDVDWSLCSGECMIRFYWLGLQASGTRWQVYKSCVPVSSTAVASATPTPTTKAPSKTKTPKPTTKAPSKTKTPKPTATESEVGGEGDMPTSSSKRNGTMTVDSGCKVKTKRS